MAWVNKKEMYSGPLLNVMVIFFETSRKPKSRNRSPLSDFFLPQKTSIT